VLISSLPSHCQKECETNLSREQKNAAVFANRIIWRNITITSLTEVTARKKKNRFSECYENVLYAGPKLTRNILTKLNSARYPPRTEKPDLQRCSRLWNLINGYNTVYYLSFACRNSEWFQTCIFFPKHFLGFTEVYSNRTSHFIQPQHLSDFKNTSMLIVRNVQKCLSIFR